TTSVLGTNGDGGNISINENRDPAYILAMQNGFIQANTAAQDAKGGRIRVNVDSLIKESNATLEIGGDEIQEFKAGSKRNIIQAADPSKNPQDIQTPTVSLDLGGAIINPASKFSEPVKMAENYCQLIGTKRASSLTQGGRGGVPEDIHKPASISFGGKRLDELLECEANR
ncbi:MAG: hypothetical protein HQK71_05610, partial [Desulfamplus sp.]|nr:hypothetical protein [Desulfamplus sp.]